MVHDEYSYLIILVSLFVFIMKILVCLDCESVKVATIAVFLCGGTL